MKTFIYQSGKEVKTGDRITYHGEPGEVQFVVSEKVGDGDLDWYMNGFSEGGFMITVRTFGSVFLTESAIGEDLQFVSRRDDC